MPACLFVPTVGPRTNGDTAPRGFSGCCLSKEPRRVRARRREKDQIGFRPRRRPYENRGLLPAGWKGVHGCLRGGVPGSTIRRTALGRRRNPGGGPHQFNQKMLDGLQNRPTSPKSVQTNAGPGCREAAGAVSCEGDCKPGSVSDSHLSRRAVAGAFKPPPKDGRAGHLSFPRCCSG